MTQIKVGDKAVFVEIKLGTSTKRFVLPSELGIIDKLRVFLNDYDNLFLVRHGDAQVTDMIPNPVADELMIPGLVFTVDYVCQGALFGHSDNIPSGTMRYSQDFIDAVLAQEVIGGMYSSESFVQTQQPPVEAAQHPPIQPPASPQDELRARLEAMKVAQTPPPQAQQTVVAPPPPVQAVQELLGHFVPDPQPASAPVVPSSYDIKGQQEKKEEAKVAAQNDLRAQLEQAKKTNTLTTQTVVIPAYEEYKTLAPYVDKESKVVSLSKSTVDRIEEIHLMVARLIDAQSVPGKGVTGKSLAIWFNTSVAEIGYDQTFELLSSKIEVL